MAVVRKLRRRNRSVETRDPCTQMQLQLLLLLLTFFAASLPSSAGVGFVDLCRSYLANVLESMVRTWADR